MRIFLILSFVIISLSGKTQENDLAGFELSIDQDYFADFIRDTVTPDRNYTISLRLGFYGALANHDYLGLPWIRKKIDGFLLDNFIYNSGFREENKSHNFVFIANGFSPSHISDEIPEYLTAVEDGYVLAGDRPFSSFTGFRSTRRIQGNKLFVHSARQLDMAIVSSFTFGFGSLGLAQSLDNLFGSKRPSANLWDYDANKPYPTGQSMPSFFPLFMYSLSGEAVVWRPMKKVLLQVRPELNLGYYTNIGIGLDFGKVMNVERHIDNLSYTDTNNPGLISVNDEPIGFSIVGGGNVRAVLYNAHVNGMFGLGKGHNFPISNTKKIILEAYAGFKLQFFQKVELNFSVNYRSSEFDSVVLRNPLWGTLGLKYLLDPPGEGCYD
ncbi:MAG: DUF2219 family protein [Saprospiraceae bacterium]|nr:lipid A deacylase LpxR family protein [Bacteroidia bacterium]NNE14247.1 DUF2219 family protein [Saprospiraceae bacterium]NNL91881.1 DUF2219 family protein [Saprospiraceae bacterium]